MQTNQFLGERNLSIYLCCVNLNFINAKLFAIARNMEKSEKEGMKMHKMWKNHETLKS